MVPTETDPVGGSLVTRQIDKCMASGHYPLQASPKEPGHFPVMEMPVMLRCKTLNMFWKKKISSKSKFYFSEKQTYF